MANGSQSGAHKRPAIPHYTCWAALLSIVSLVGQRWVRGAAACTAGTCFIRTGCALCCLPSAAFLYAAAVVYAIAQCLCGACMARLPCFCAEVVEVDTESASEAGSALEHKSVIALGLSIHLSLWDCPFDHFVWESVHSTGMVRQLKPYTVAALTAYQSYTPVQVEHCSARYETTTCGLYI